MKVVVISLLVVALTGCDSLVDAGSPCESGAPGIECSGHAPGIPAFPPPPCWNEAGEIQPDEVCEELDQGPDASGTSSGPLPPPPPLPG